MAKGTKKAVSDGSGEVPDRFNQVLDDPIGALRLQPVGRRAVLPNRITNRFQWVGSECRLCEQTREISRKDIAAATLREVRVARRVDVDFARAAPNQSLVSL